MLEANRRVLVISDDHERSAEWCKTLEADGWQVMRVGTRSEAIVSMPEFKPDLLFLEVVPGQHVSEIEEDFAQGCRDAGVAAIPILTDPTPEDVADSFRRGAIDALIEPFDAQDMLDAVRRAGEFNDLYRENIGYRRQLERTNRDLQDSLNTLRMDQLAGREVQQNILPGRPLVFRDYRITHRIVPSLYLSGDFVGYNVLIDRFLIFWVADVSGHGASSAFVTVMLSFMIRQVSRRYTGTENDAESLKTAPQGLLELVNRQILSMKVDKHLTIFVGAIDTQTNSLRYATGAQLPMPVLLTDAGAEFLVGKGKPIGLFEDASWVIEEIALPDKFALTIISDGFLDCLSGTTIAQKEASLLNACRRAGVSHERVCTELGIDKVHDAPDDVSLLTVVKGGDDG